jgi:hypothetical protein
VHHRVDLMVRQESRDQRVVAGIANNQLPRRDGSPKPFAQVIEDDNPLAGLAQLSHDMTADVSGAAGDQYRS